MVSLRPETPSGRNQAATGNGLWLETAINWKRPSFFFKGLWHGKGNEREKPPCRNRLMAGNALPRETGFRQTRSSTGQQIPTVKNTMPKGNSGVHENATKHLKQACSTSRWQNQTHSTRRSTSLEPRTVVATLMGSSQAWKNRKPVEASAKLSQTLCKNRQVRKKWLMKLCKDRVSNFDAGLWHFLQENFRLANASKPNLFARTEKFEKDCL